MTEWQIPETARAAVQHELRRGATIALAEVPVHVPGPDELVIRTKAAGINPVDVKTSRGEGVAGGIPAAVRAAGVTLGWDIAGEVVAVGDAVTTFRPGDRVFGLVRFPALGGTFAEIVTVPAAEVRRIPDGVSFVEAAAVPLVALTAWQALFDTATLAAGQRVLVHGGSGGVGHVAIQLATHVGAHVITTASARNAEIVRELGADEVIDYRTQRFEDLVREVDVVLNTVEGDALARSWRVLRPGGIIVSILATPKVPSDAPTGARGRHILVHPDGEQIAAVADLLARGALRPRIQRIGSLDELPVLFAELHEGHVVGKLVVTF